MYIGLFVCGSLDVCVCVPVYKGLRVSFSILARVRERLGTLDSVGKADVPNCHTHIYIHIRACAREHPHTLLSSSMQRTGTRACVCACMCVFVPSLAIAFVRFQASVGKRPVTNPHSISHAFCLAPGMAARVPESRCPFGCFAVLRLDVLEGRSSVPSHWRCVFLDVVYYMYICPHKI